MWYNYFMIEKTRKHFLDAYEKSGNKVNYPGHVKKVEEISEKMIKEHPEADREILLISVWLHDIGTMIGDRSKHDVISEKEAKRFLSKEGLDKDKIDKIAHCVRAHRNKDIKPKTIEAKILAVSDAISHLIRGPYMIVKNKSGREKAVEKLERDYRDLGILPGKKKQYTQLYEA